jgi:tRNA (cmo5U34)-methyltransferase
MSKFDQTNWVQPESNRDYRDGADHFIPERRLLMRVAASCYKFHCGAGGRMRVLDLGCGDGILAESLFRQDAQMELALVDGSADMLVAARKRLAGAPGAVFLQATFQEIIAGKFPAAPFDFIGSAFAIHHLEMPEKRSLFRSLAGLLRPGGLFLNIDVTTGAPYTDWYYRLWQEWILDHVAATGADPAYVGVPFSAHDKDENHYDPLEDQLAALRAAGLVDVACHFRFGLFSIYGGRKPGGEG